MRALSDVALSVDDSHMRYAGDIPVVELVAALMEMLNISPSRARHVVLDNIRVFIDRKAHNSDILPSIVALVALQHLVVVRHGFLAGWAPSRPKFN